MRITLPLLAVLALAVVASVNAANFLNDVVITWGGDGRAMILDNGNQVQLSLDKNSGSGFQSKQEYLFGRFDMEIKVVPGDAAGLVTTCYLSSKGEKHDEIDFEFLGNSSGHPYTLHTNIFSQGKGNREQEFNLWFDARLDFHTYSIVWTPSNVIWYVDEMPIREFKNLERQKGVPYLKSQPQRLYSSLWNGEGWVTRGGLVKTDWSLAPFTASYRNFNIRPIDELSSSTLDSAGMDKLKMVREKYMIYDYCKDSKRFPRGFPPECSVL